jgi:hypothetical protein
MVILLPYIFKYTFFYGIIFQSLISDPTLSVFYIFSHKVWSIPLIYHMVLKNFQKNFVYQYILLPRITIKKMKLNKKWRKYSHFFICCFYIVYLLSDVFMLYFLNKFNNKNKYWWLMYKNDQNKKSV